MKKKTKKLVPLVSAMMFAALFLSGNAAQASVATNESADIVIGQQNMTTETPAVSASAMAYGRNPFYYGGKLFVSDYGNNRVLIYNSLPAASGASADVVIGQPDMTSWRPNQGAASAAANTLDIPASTFYDGSKFFVCDSDNSRVLIYNSIPTSNNASANVVIGQPDMTSNSINQGGSAGANTLNLPTFAFSDGKRLFVSDWGNSRVLIYNSIPTTNNASADIVIGQQNMTSGDANQGGSASATTFDHPNGIGFNGKKLFVADQRNHRVLIFNSIPTANNAAANVVIGQANMTSVDINQGGASAGANTLYWPVSVFPYGPKLILTETGNNRALIFNSIPTSNNASANVVIGQPDMTSNGDNQGGAVAANTLSSPRGAFVAATKLLIGDFLNSRILIYNSFGSQWTITKNHSRTLSGDEKIKVKKNKVEFSGKKTAWKKGYVRIYRDGHYVKKAKIKKNGKWSGSFSDKGSAVKEYVLKYFSKSGDLQLISEMYVLGINRGSLVESTLQKADFEGSGAGSDGAGKKSGSGADNSKDPKASGA